MTSEDIDEQLGNGIFFYPNDGNVDFLQNGKIYRPSLGRLLSAWVAL